MMAMVHQHLAAVVKFFGPRASNLSNLRLVSTSPVNKLDQKWREERGLPINPNSHGVLTDSPDYSYHDGRPTPYGSRQRKRIIKQQEVAEQIIKLSGEIDFAVERHKQVELQEQQRKKQILDNKLKPKGILLLKKK